MANEAVYLLVGIGIGLGIAGVVLALSALRGRGEAGGYLTTFARDESGRIVEIVEKPLKGGIAVSPA
jgi:hypothetical protein